MVPLCGRGRLIWSTIRTRSANDLAPIFLIRLPRWTLTVISLMPTSAAICLFMSPDATKPMISFSRGVRESYRPCSPDITLSDSRRAQSLLSPAWTCIKQVLLAHRLGQELDRSGFHGPHRHRDIAMSGDENDGNMNIVPDQFRLEIEAAHTRKPDVQDQAARRLGKRCLAELRCRIE